MIQVFLSYSSLDADFVDRLALDLRDAGMVIWKAPDSVLPGESWVAAVERGLMTSSHFVVVKSPNAVASSWVRFEFNVALARHHEDMMVVIPIDYIPCETPPFWMAFQHVSFKSSYQRALLELIRRLQSERPLNPPRPLPPDTTVINVNIGGDVYGVVNVAGRTVMHDGPDAGRPILDLSELFSRVKNPFERRKKPEPIQQSAQAAPAEPIKGPTKPLNPKRAREEVQEVQEIAIEPLQAQFPPDVTHILRPPFEWCEIPAGRVKLGDGVGTFDVQPFYMAKYPITYAQYQVFVDAPDGFYNDLWWHGLAADDNNRKAPGEQLWKLAMHPRENVSWYDAVVFFRWLSEKIGFEVRLPTEWEWQWAAQGSDGRGYPWGDALDPSYANIKGGGRVTTTPVNRYRQGASPFEVVDMCGNVWEWCLNSYNSPTETSLAGEHMRALRGGAYFTDGDVSVTRRIRNSPQERYMGYGFRVVMPIP